jgi:hypothetical protein
MGCTIVFVDEVKFQQSADFRGAKTWAAPNDKLVIHDRAMPKSNINVSVAIDENGIVHHEFTEGRYDQNAYLDFLRRMRSKYDKNKRLAVFYDGLSAHTTKAVVQAVIDELKILPIQNIAYEPNCNAIEGLFA